MSTTAVGLMGVVVSRVRGGARPGEVRVVHGGIAHAYIAYSDEPIVMGTQVLVINSRGARQVDVEPWTMPGLDATGVAGEPERS